MFSPYYAAARRRGTADPLDHCALNIALYGPRKRWAMTERRRAATTRDGTSFVIGPSVLHWDGDALVIDIDEMTVPFPSRMRGRVRVHPCAITARTFALDAKREHRWWPIAPRARVDVALDSPALRWSGNGYLDSNAGDVPLESTFACWDWSRVALRNGAAVLYDTQCRDGTRGSLALHFDPGGAVQHFDPPRTVALARSGWRVARATRADDARASVTTTLEDAPFYARSLLATRLLGEDTAAVHESLSLDRFSNRVVQLMLPFRMPRALR